MKKIISVLTVLMCFSVQAKYNKPFTFKDFELSNNKNQFLTDFMIKETKAWKKEKPKEFKTIFNKVNNYKLISQNNFVAHIQISCDNLKEDWHGLMAKLPNMSSQALPCSYDKVKFEQIVWCKGKL